MTAWSRCAPLDPSRNTAALTQAYLAALDGFDRTLLDRNDAERTRAHGLSGLFLPSVPPKLHQAHQRIMVVGAETAIWNVLKESEVLGSMEDYVDRAMAKHDRFFRKRLENKRQDPGLTFLNFMRDVARQCGTDGLIYSNLFCCDWNGGSPMPSPHNEMVRHYSARLLQAQVAFFAPSIIIFANGSASAGARRAVFPTKGPHAVCSKGADFVISQRIPNSQLWEFKLNDAIHCYRIQHPSSFTRGASHQPK